MTEDACRPDHRSDHHHHHHLDHCVGPLKEHLTKTKFSTNLEIISRYRPRYRDNTRPDIRVCPDIAFSDIVSPRHDMISGKKPPISVQYRDIPVPCQTRYYQYRARYRVFSRYWNRYRVNIGAYPFLAKTDIGFFTDIGPDMVPILQKISGYTDIGTKKTRCHSRCVCNRRIREMKCGLQSRASFVQLHRFSLF
jgi:hypothetical protein